MSYQARITGLVGLLMVVLGVLCFGPWYQTSGATISISSVKLGSLILAALTTLVVYAKSRFDDPQHKIWLVLAVGFILLSGGQGVLFTYQVVLDTPTPFPSFGDLLFVASTIFFIWALFSFCLLSFRSGLPLGDPLVFWSPALAVAVLFLTLGYFLLAPILRAGGPWPAMFLNLYYPVTDTVALAPCVVMLRVGLKFRGGGLLMVWMPLTVGFGAVLTSDILFAYFSTLNLQWLIPLLDFLYAAGYLLMARGMHRQLGLMRT